MTGRRLTLAKTAAAALALLLCAMSLAPRPAQAEPPDRSSPPRLGAMPRFDIRPPTEFKLGNGLRVWFVERRRAPLIDVVAVVDAASSSDPPSLPGLASFTADMLTHGAGELDAIAFSNACDALGAHIGSFAGDDFAGVALHVEASRFDRAFDLMTRALTQPRFDDDEWQRRKQQTAGSLLVQSQEPAELAQLAALRAAWGPDHRYGSNPGGTPRALLAATSGDLRAFHRAHYRPERTTLIVVGAIDAGALKRHLERTLGAWRGQGDAPATPTLAPPVARAGRQLVTVHVPGAAQTALRVLHAVPADVQPWTPDVEVMNTLLGGSFTSRLNNNLREKNGYTYGAGSRFDLRAAGNVFAVRTSVATAVTSPAVREIFNELERMAQPATEDEVERARGVTALTLPSQFDNGQSIALLWASVVARGMDPARITGFMSSAASVGVDAVGQAARRLLSPQHATIVAVGDMELVGKDLEQFGSRVELTPEDLLPGLAELAVLIALGIGPDASGPLQPTSSP